MKINDLKKVLTKVVKSETDKKDLKENNQQSKTMKVSKTTIISPKSLWCVAPIHSILA